MELTIAIAGRLSTSTLTLRPTDTVGFLKAEIHRVADAPIAEQEIACQRVRLEEDRKTLAHYGVTQSQTLNVTLSPVLAEPQQYKINSDEEDWYLQARRYDTVASVKEQIEGRIRVTKNTLRLLYKGEELEDAHTLAHYNVRDEIEVLRPGDLAVRVEAEYSQHCYIAVSSKRPVAHLKVKALQRCGQSHNKYSLRMNETILDDNQSLGDCDVQQNALLYLDFEQWSYLKRHSQDWNGKTHYYFDTVAAVRRIAAQYHCKPAEDVRIFHETTLLTDDQRIGPTIAHNSREVFVLFPTEILVAISSISYSQTWVAVVPNAPVSELLQHCAAYCYEVKTLMYNGQALEADRRLSDYRIEHETVLQSLVEINMINSSEIRVTLPLISLPNTISGLKAEIERTVHVPISDQRIFRGYGSSVDRETNASESLCSNHSQLVLLVPTDIHITVIRSDNSHFCVAADRAEPVQTVKTKIERDTEIPVARQSLYLDGVKLEDSSLLQELMSPPSATVTLLDSEETLLKVRTGDAKVESFLIHGDKTVREIQGMMQSSRNFWFYRFTCDLVLHLNGQELDPDKRISQVGLKTGDTVDAEARTEVFITVKATLPSSTQLMLLGSHTVLDIKREVYGSSHHASLDCVYYNREPLDDATLLGSLELGKRCEMVYRNPWEKLLIVVRTTDEESLYVGITEGMNFVADLQNVSRYQVRKRGKMVYAGKQIESRRPLESLGLQMWSSIDLLLRGSLLLWIKPTKRASFNVGVRPADTIGKVKEAISRVLLIAGAQQRLIHRSAELADTQTVESCGIRNGDTLELLDPEDCVLAVETHTGKRLTCCVEKNTTVTQLKTLIEKKTGWLRSKIAILSAAGDESRAEELAGLVRLELIT